MTQPANYKLKQVVAKVYSKQIAIGEAKLKVGDYTMGGLYGVFIPNEYYLQELQSKVRLLNNKEQPWQECLALEVSIKMPDEYTLQPLTGVMIYDIEELSDEPIEIHMAGIACDIIDSYFDTTDFLKILNS